MSVATRSTSTSRSSGARCRSTRSAADFREVPGDLRGYLTVVPESRWLKHADNLRFFIDETIDHYTEHTADLEAILDACAAGAPDLPTQKALDNR